MPCAAQLVNSADYLHVAATKPGRSERRLRDRARWNVSATNYSAPHGVTGCRPSREHRGTGNPRADRRRVYQAQPARERAGLRAEEAPRSRAEGVAAPAGGARRTRHVARLAARLLLWSSNT